MRLFAAVLLGLAALARADDMYDPENYDDFYDTDTFVDDFDSYNVYSDKMSLDPWEYGLGDEYSDFDWRSTYDDTSNQYYSDEFEQYYDRYGTYADEYGDDYPGVEDATLQSDCVANADGSANITSGGAHRTFSHVIECVYG